MDIERTVEFLLNQQAQTATHVQILAEQQTALVGVVRQQQEQISAINGILATLIESHRALAEAQRQTEERLDKLTQRVDTLTQRVDTLTQRMDTLAHIFEDWLRRGGDGSRTV